MFMLCWSSAIKQKFAAYGFVYVGDKTTIHCFFFLLNNVWLSELKFCLWIMNHEFFIRTLILMVILSCVHALHIWQKTLKTIFENLDIILTFTTGTTLSNNGWSSVIQPRGHSPLGKIYFFKITFVPGLIFFWSTFH